MKIHGIKRAVRDFNRYKGRADIMLNIDDGSVWTDIFTNCGERAEYDSESIVRIASKGNVIVESYRNTVTSREIEDRIRSCEITGHLLY